MDDPQDSHHPDDMYRHSDGRGPVDNDLSMRDDGKPPNSGMGGDPQDSLGGHGHGHGMTNDGSLNGSAAGGGMAIRPIFLGNLSHGCLASDVEGLFLHPVATGMGGMGGDAHDPDGMGDRPAPFAVDRVDMKRGYCFVFLKDADTLAEKDRVEQYVADIGGMNINNVSKALRAEFARGDGRIKRKEDERRKKITPSETLFVVNFHEETTKREDLQMLFEPFGELVRIDMKRNYAFVQFRTVDEAQRAKDATNGGKLDQSEITVEFVARRMGEGDRRRDDRGGYRGDRGGYRGDRGPRRDRDYRRDDRYDDRGGYRGDRYGGPRDRRDYRRRSRSRSRSPGYRGSYDRRRSRSPEVRGGREYDDHRSRPSYRRSRSPEVRGGREYEDRGGRDEYRADRGYRSERGYGEEGR